VSGRGGGEREAAVGEAGGGAARDAEVVLLEGEDELGDEEGEDEEGRWRPPGPAPASTPRPWSAAVT
jgi:hypothetical protein